MRESVPATTKFNTRICRKLRKCRRYMMNESSTKVDAKHERALPAKVREEITRSTSTTILNPSELYFCGGGGDGDDDRIAEKEKMTRSVTLNSALGSCSSETRSQGSDKAGEPGSAPEGIRGDRCQLKGSWKMR